MTPEHQLHYWAEQLDGCERPLFDEEDYVHAGIPLAQARQWVRACLPPEIARDFTLMGMTPDEAWGWGILPSLVSAYREFGFTATAGRKWADLRIGPNEAAAWRDAGFQPMEAALVYVKVKESADARLWALTGLTPSQVHELASAGASPWAHLRR